MLAINVLPVVAEQGYTWTYEIEDTPVWVTVIPGDDRVAELSLTDAWWEWGNTTSDTYIFAVYNESNVKAIVTFDTLDDGQLEARIYANPQNNARLDYTIQNGEVLIYSDRGHPYYTVRPEGGAWLVDGNTNYNLTVLVDGPDPDGVTDQMVTVGSEQPGIPGWSITRVVEDLYPTLSYPRFRARERLDNAPAFSIVPPFMPSFPYLGILEENDVDLFEENLPPFYIDLGNGAFKTYPFTGNPQLGTYNVDSYSFPPLVSFESPAVWYDLDPNTRSPELAVRSWYFPAEDPAIRQYRPTIPALSTFRYSWKTSDPGGWAYALNVAGPYAYSEEVDVGDTRIFAVNADDLPAWVLSKKWDIITFVESIQDYTGEDIPYYSMQNLDILNWFAGHATEVPGYLAQPNLDDVIEADDSISIPAGFRGEYSRDQARSATLYMSGIDQRLHLLHAEGGVLNIVPGVEVHYADMNDDGYVDQWHYLNDQQLQKQLYYSDGYLVLDDETQVTIKQSNPPLAIVETAPPKNQQEWQTFTQLISDYSLGYLSWDFKGMLTTLPGEVFSISNSQITNFRVTEMGFRFALDVSNDYSSEAASFFDVQNILPGRYIVTYQSGEFNISPYIDEVPELLPATLIYTPTTLSALSTNELSIELDNPGSQEYLPLFVQGYVRQADNGAIKVFEQSVALLADESESLVFKWAPIVPGEWELVLLWGIDASEMPTTTLGSGIVNVNVNAVPDPDIQQIWAISNLSRFDFWLAFLVSLGVIAGCLFSLIIINRNRGAPAQ